MRRQGPKKVRCPFASLPRCLSRSPSVYLCSFLSPYLSLFLSVSLSLCLSVSLSLSPSLARSRSLCKFFR